MRALGLFGEIVIIDYLGSKIEVNVDEDILISKAHLERAGMFGNLLENFDDYFSFDYIPVLSNRMRITGSSDIWHRDFTNYIINYLTLKGLIHKVYPRETTVRSNKADVSILTIYDTQIWVEMAGLCYLLKVHNPFSLLSPGGTPIKRRLTVFGTMGHRFYIPLGSAHNLLTSNNKVQRTLNDITFKVLDTWENLFII